jgi:hypothetical protein
MRHVLNEFDSLEIDFPKKMFFLKIFPKLKQTLRNTPGIVFFSTPTAKNTAYSRERSRCAQGGI